jgi:hypothetical protein
VKRTTIEEFDQNGKLVKRTVTEEQDPQYPWVLQPWVIPIPQSAPYVPMPSPWQPVIVCEGSGYVNPGNATITCTAPCTTGVNATMCGSALLQ